MNKNLFTEERVPLRHLAGALSVDRTTIHAGPAVRNFPAVTNVGKRAEVTAAANSK